MFKVDLSKIRGQESAVRLLSRAVLSGSYAPLYLFYGPQGVGKATAALEFAKAANCRSKTVRPCGKCSQCKKISRFVHPDIFILLPTKSDDYTALERRDGEVRPYNIDMTKEISIKRVRELQYQLSRPPMEAKRRFVIILNGENLSLEAQNSFLKTLEEPPSNTTFIMVSSNPELILPTIRSRARKIRFNPLPIELFRSFFDTDEGTVNVLWHLSGGSVGMAREILSRNLLEMRARIVELMITKDINALLELKDEFVRSRKTASDVALLYGIILRDIMLKKEDSDGLVVNIDLEEKLEQAAKELNWKNIEDAFSALRRVQKGISRNVSLQNMFFVLFRPFYRNFEAVVV